MTQLPDRVKGWIDVAGVGELAVVDLAGELLRVVASVSYDGDDLLLLVPEGVPAHHALIYDPQASVLVRDPADGRHVADVRGEVEMTTAGVDELRRRTGGVKAAADEAWLVVRVVPTTVVLRG